MYFFDIEYVDDIHMCQVRGPIVAERVVYQVWTRYGLDMD